MYRKGFALVECNFYIFIFLIIMCVTWPIIIRVVSTLNDITGNKAIEESNINNSFIVVKEICKSDNIANINYYDDKIIIRYKEGTKESAITKIEKFNSRLALVHYKNELEFNQDKKTTSNYLTSNIKKVCFYKKERVTYMKIVTENNESYISCL